MVKSVPTKPPNLRGISYAIVVVAELLTLTMPNSLNGIVHLTFLALSIILFRDMKMKT